jgi:hypothetical protein
VSQMNLGQVMGMEHVPWPFGAGLYILNAIVLTRRVRTKEMALALGAERQDAGSTMILPNIE